MSDSKEYKELSYKFKYHWEEGRQHAKNITEYIHVMIRILHKNHPNWSLNRIVRQIYLEHEDLPGFTKYTIYRQLPDEHRRLLPSSRKRRETKVANT